MSSYQIDMTHGSIFRKMTVFVLPLIFTYALQSLFNAADMAVIGKFSSHESLAAIGATGTLCTLFLKILIGLSTGTNAVIATCCGGKDPVKTHQSVHTAMALSIWSGIIGSVVALILSRPLLVLMKTPDNILDRACLYFRIYIAGLVFMTVYNFGCAVLRSFGDSKRPLYILLLSGVVNVLLNLLFVLVFRMDVAGVAVATLISNALAAGLIFRLLILSSGGAHVSYRKMKIRWPYLRDIFWIGIPAGVNSSMYNVANMFMQSSVNTFGSLAVAGISAAVMIEAPVSVISSAFQQAIMTFTAQNYGAGDFRRVVRCILTGLLCCSVTPLIVGLLILMAGPQLLGLFTDDARVVDWGMIRLQIMMSTLFLGGAMDGSCGALRGIGSSVLPTISSLVGACIFRILWILMIFPLFGSMESLICVFPLSWVIVLVFNAAALFVLLKMKYAKARKNALYPE